MFDFSFSESEHPPTVLYTQIVRTHPISAKIYKSEAVFSQFQMMFQVFAHGT